MTVDKKRILIIDDEPEIVTILRIFAERAGHVALGTTNVAEFKNAMDRQQPDIVIMDLAMPDVDGVELLRVLASYRVSAGIILISGAGPRVMQSAALLAESQGLTVIGSLPKPFTYDGFQALIGRPVQVKAQPPKGPKAMVNPEDLARAIKEGRIKAHFQPQIDLNSNQVSGCEALARWEDPERGMIFPDLFIPVAESEGMMPELTTAVARSAISFCAGADAAGFPLSVSINVSAQSLSDLQFPEAFKNLLNELKVPPERVVVEITESRLFEDPVRSLDVLTRLRLQRLGLSIDDFGTGFSTFQQLQRIPFSELKIDREFVMTCATSSESASIVQASLDLAARLGMRSVGEGVETMEVAGILKQMGCDMGQGYVYSRPLPADAFLSWLRARPQ